MAEGEEDKKRAVRARAEKMRAERRRRIGQNAQSRMERVKSLQQRLSVEEEMEPEPVKDKTNEDVTENTRISSELAINSTEAEDPPDELVSLPETQPPPSLPSTSPHIPSPSLLSWFTCSLQSTKKLCLLSSSLVPLLWMLTDYSLPFFLLWFTCEFTLCLTAFITIRMTRDSPTQVQLQGKLAIVKAAVGLMYPTAVKKIEYLHQLCVVMLCMVQDLCVSVFVLVVLATLCDHFS